MTGVITDIVASGWPSPLSRAAHGWDLTPLLATVAALLVWRFGLRREITWVVTGVALVLGLLLGTAAAGWGLLPTWGVAILAACVFVVVASPRGTR
jgi:hypothetical protein